MGDLSVHRSYRSTTVAVVAVVASLLLAACGATSSNDANNIASSTASAAITPTPTMAADPNAPMFRLPRDVKVEFRGFDSSDATTKDVLQDVSFAIEAIVEAKAGVDITQMSNFKRYFTGPQAASYADMLTARFNSGKTVTGTYRYYAPTVKRGEDGTQLVGFCEDQRLAYDKDVKTGQASLTSPSPLDFRAWTLTVHQVANGDWQVATFDWDEAASCIVA